MTFKDLGLKESILESISKLGFETIAEGVETKNSMNICGISVVMRFRDIYLDVRNRYQKLKNY